MTEIDEAIAQSMFAADGAVTLNTAIADVDAVMATAFRRALAERGWAVVPMEPTEEMIEAYKTATWHEGAMSGLPKSGPGKKIAAEKRKAVIRYRAMLAAAQPGASSE